MSPKEKFTLKVLEKFPEVRGVLSYTNAKTPAVLECRQGHRWQVVPSNLISRGSGGQCPACNNTPGYSDVGGVLVFIKRKTSAGFEAQLHDINPQVSLVGEYLGAHSSVTLKCHNQHTWTAIPTNLLARPAEATCPHCVDKRSSSKQTLEAAQAKIQAKYPQLQLLEYTKASVECAVIDTQCGHQFTSWYANLVQGRGYRCTTCVPEYGTSKNEVAIAEWIQQQYGGWIERNDRTIIKPKELDLVLPELALAIEYNSPYTHRDKDHLQKLQLVEAAGFRLLQINEDEWTTKQHIVKAKLSSILGKNMVVGARKCELQSIQFPSEFLDQNHLQGRGQPTPHNYGLFFGGELVAVMTFAKPRFNPNYSWELVRYCTLGGVTVAGGAGRLLKAFQNLHPGESILSYSDRRWSQGDLYKSLGFLHLHSSQPGYAYYKANAKLSRYACQKHLLEAKFPQFWDPLLAEHEIMQLAGYIRMYDCGTDVWIL